MATLSYDTVDLRSGALTSADMADIFYDMYRKYTNICTHTSGTETIRIYNSFDLKFEVNYVGSTVNILDINSGTTIKSLYYYMGGVNGDTNGIFDTTIISSPNVFYTCYRKQNTAWRMGGELSFMYDGSKHYISMLAGNSMENWYIEADTSILCWETQDPSYCVKKLANYKLSLRDLFLSNICIMSSSSGEFIQLPDFKSSSNVAFNTVISANNKNYYALGTNTLFEIDEES